MIPGPAPGRVRRDAAEARGQYRTALGASRAGTLSYGRRRRLAASRRGGNPAPVRGVSGQVGATGKVARTVSELTTSLRGRPGRGVFWKSSSQGTSFHGSGINKRHRSLVSGRGGSDPSGCQLSSNQPASPECVASERLRDGSPRESCFHLPRACPARSVARPSPCGAFASINGLRAGHQSPRDRPPRSGP
jgi:hypothetical protein